MAAWSRTARKTLRSVDIFIFTSVANPLNQSSAESLSRDIFSTASPLCGTRNTGAAVAPMPCLVGRSAASATLPSSASTHGEVLYACVSAFVGPGAVARSTRSLPPDRQRPKLASRKPPRGARRMIVDPRGTEMMSGAARLGIARPRAAAMPAGAAHKQRAARRGQRAAPGRASVSADGRATARALHTRNHAAPGSLQPPQGTSSALRGASACEIGRGGRQHHDLREREPEPQRCDRQDSQQQSKRGELGPARRHAAA